MALVRLVGNSGFEEVARRIEVSPELLRDAILDAQVRPAKIASISVRGARWGHYFCRPGTVLWRVAETLHIEPEELRDVILDVYAPEPGEVATIHARRPR